MMARMEANEVRAQLGRAALPLEASAAWLDAWPDITGAYHQDAAAFSHLALGRRPTGGASGKAGADSA